MYELQSYWKTQKLSPKPNLQISRKHMYFPLHKKQLGQTGPECPPDGGADTCPFQYLLLHSKEPR